MPINLESLSSTAQRAFLARLAHALAICARDTYEVGTENVLDSRTLRAYNELLLRVSGSVVSHLSGSKGYSLQCIVEMIRSCGHDYGKASEMDWALQFALEKIEKEPMG